MAVPVTAALIAACPAPATGKARRDRSRRAFKGSISRRSAGAVRGQGREQEQGDDVGDLDHRVHGGAGGVLVGIADSVAGHGRLVGFRALAAVIAVLDILLGIVRSEEHTSELQSLMRISYAVFCLKKKKKQLLSQQYHTVIIKIKTDI